METFDDGGGRSMGRRWIPERRRATPGQKFVPHCSPCMPLGDQSAELVVRAGFASGYWGVVP